MHALSHDIFLEIFSHIPPIQAYSLRRVDKHLSETITLETISVILINKIKVRLLIVLGEDYDEFVKMMDEFQCILTGSFVLQMMLDIQPGEWSNPLTDIDVYLSLVIENSNIIENNVSLTCDKLGEPISSWDNHDITFYDMSYDGDKITDLCPIVARGNKQIIEFIYTTVSTFDRLIKFIENSFDFSICRNMIYVKDGKFHARLYDINSIYERRISLKDRPIYVNTVDRYRKYKSRGFDIIPNNYKDFVELCLNSENFEIYRAKLLGKDNYHKICQVYDIDRLKQKSYTAKQNTKDSFLIADNNILMYGESETEPDIVGECNKWCPFSLFEDTVDHDHICIMKENDSKNAEIIIILE